MDMAHLEVQTDEAEDEALSIRSIACQRVPCMYQWDRATSV